MNLNEVKKHVFFNLALYIAIGICFLLSIFAILVSPVKAIEQTSDITNDIHLDTTVCASSGGRGTYCADYGYTRYVKTTYNGRAECIGFAFDYYFSNSRDYTINIVANSNDFRNNNLTFSGYSYTTYPANASSVAVQGRFVSKNKLQIVFPYDPQQTHAVSICSNGGYMTGDTNYNIKQVYLSYDDGQQDISGVIDNATQNTTDIINNNNSNTTDIIDSNNQNTTDIINNNNSNTDLLNSSMLTNTLNIIKQLANTCDNAVNVSKIEPGFYNSSGVFVTSPTSQINGFNTASGSININISQYGGVTSDYIPVDSSITYYLKLGLSSGSNGFYQFTFFDSNKNYLNSYNLTQQGRICQNVGACMPIRTAYIRFSYRSNIAINNLTLGNITINASNNSFCTYGTQTSNKLDGISGVLSGLSNKQQQTNDLIDEQNDLQQQQNDYLMDDTNPSIPSSDITNVIDGVEIDNPLSYLLTLPLHLISKINQIFSTGTCSRVDLGAFGFASDYHFILPCINFENYLGSSLWNTIDIFVSIGLLAFTLYKIYHAVANILTLGGEDEVTRHLGYLSPMEFLAQIIGGGGFGVVTGKGNL